MGVRNRKREIVERLGSKTLDAQFLTEVGQGLNCSPFEAEAVLDVVKEIFGPYLGEAPLKAPPGKVTLVAVDADEPAGKPVAQCEKRTVCLMVHRGAEDDRILQEQGPRAFRQARLVDVCQEAMSQGALLTCEDLAYRVFFVTPRTISRDLQTLRSQDPDCLIPLRSTLQDIGPVLTHRAQIVRLALEGKTLSQICQIMHHSPAAVANYLSTFTRCVQLMRSGMEIGQIAYLLRRGRGLVRSYLDLLRECETDKNRAYHLEELLRVGMCGTRGKKAERR